MKGNTLSEFINDLLTTGGPEKEYLYRGKRYMLECIFDEATQLTELVIFQCFDDEDYVFRCKGKNFAECVEQYEKATIYDGRTIYEAEDEIEILFG